MHPSEVPGAILPNQLEVVSPSQNHIVTAQKSTLQNGTYDPEQSTQCASILLLLQTHTGIAMTKEAAMAHAQLVGLLLSGYHAEAGMLLSPQVLGIC